MTWTKLADGLPRHPKIVGLSDAAFRLHIYALCYSSEQLTDGEIPDAALSTLAPRRAKKLAEELVNAQVWHEKDHDCDACPPIVSGYYLHGFLDYNPSAEEVEEGRSKRSDKARRAANARWDRPTLVPPSNAPSIPQASTLPMPHDAPVPSRPVPTEFIHSTPDARGAPKPVDDDERHLANRVLERIADSRMATRTDVRDPQRYRASILGELHHEHDSRLLQLIRTHPLAPVDVLAGAVLGEPNSIHVYRQEATG